MAQPLRQPAPSSAVARLLDPSAAARAVAAQPPSAPVAAAQPAAERSTVAATPCINRELVLTPAAARALDRLVEVFREATGSRLSTSHAARALLVATAACIEPIEREARRLGALRLPGNARGREGERERFERRLAAAIVAGFRAAAALEPGEG